MPLVLHRPAPIRLINRLGAVAARFGLRPSLDVEGLISAAQARTGLEDLGPSSFRTGLEVLVESLEADAQLTPIGRIAARQRLIDLLAVRLQLIAYRSTHPEVAAQDIRQPVFVLGLPRTGTTVLYGMLAADPALRAPLSWEVARPVPPPTHPTDDPRVRLADRDFDRFRRLVPHVDTIHPLGAMLPQECLALMAPEFRSYEFPTTFPVPGYWEWLRDADLRPAYEFERWFLQHLQSGRAGRHWLLKTPAHLMWLDTLLEVFPDALLVHTHRDPATVIASVSSLMWTLRSAVSDTVDPAEVGREQLEVWRWALGRAVEVRDRLPEGRVIDVHYRDTVEDPVGTVRRIYEHWGWEFTPEVAAGVRRYLEQNPKRGVHRYRLEDFGLSRAETSAAFADYRARFGIEEESR